MSPEAIIAVIGGALALSGVMYIVIRKLPKKIRASHYTRKWREVQRLCADKTTWHKAIIDSDELLDEVLRKRRKEGKTMGERLVSAQKSFTANDAVWKAHKLANRLRQEPQTKLKENDVKDSLVAFRQALRDLGAL
jgi:hypothetical protein